MSMSGTPTLAVKVAAVIPLPDAMGGQGEILGLVAFGNVRLPSGDAGPRESLFAATARMVRQVTGAGVAPQRLVYLVERAGRELIFCVLCELTDVGLSDTRVGVRFVSLATSPDEFEPQAVRELLIEDVREGFVRPLVHILVSEDDGGNERTSVIW